MTYDLSVRQRKSLLERAQPIDLALPYPADQPDALAWARSVLPADVRRLVVSAEEAEILVRPKHGVPGLTGVLGEICDAHRPGELGLRVVVLVVRLSPPRPRHDVAPLQWPASAAGEHRRWP